MNSAAQIKRRRFQIYRQGHAGNYSPGFSTDSAIEAVKAFLAANPAFEGGDMHLWNHREQRVCASVEWNVCKSEFGPAIRRRMNVFFDCLLGAIFRQIRSGHSRRLSPCRLAGADLVR